LIDHSTASAVRTERAQSEWMVVGASSLGTLFEWYDFFLYGALAGNIAGHFFSAANERARTSSHWPRLRRDSS
jgi:hypothetical protein